LIQEIGVESISRKICDRISYIYERVVELGLEPFTPQAPERRAGIVTFRDPRKDSRELYKSLQASGVLCAQRTGGIRFSPHFYTPSESLDRALAAVERA
jgi:selenocysteine lyase/cysteine desulfurase